MSDLLFEKYRTALLSLPLSSIWRGHGSALFLEFGELRGTTRRDGSAGHPRGRYSVMIEWSWRIEDESSILCGSWSDENDWLPVLARLEGQTVETVALFGRLPELSIKLSGQNHVVSFMTASGQPAWTVFDNTGEEQQFLHVENGRLREGNDTANAALPAGGT